MPSSPRSNAAVEPVNRGSSFRSSSPSVLAPSRPKLEPIHVPNYQTSPISGMDSAQSDISFAASTISYLGSPTGRQALQQEGLVLPISAPDTEWSVLTPMAFRSPKTQNPTDNESVISLPWPRPPNTYPPSPQTKLPLAQHRSYNFIYSPGSSGLPPSPFRDLEVIPSPAVPLLTAKSPLRSYRGNTSSRDGVGKNLI